MLTNKKHEVFVFSETHYNEKTPIENQIKIGKPYMLINKKIEKIKMSFNDNSGDSQETSYFYELDEYFNVDTSKIYSALTNWWFNELKFSESRVLGHITSVVTFNEINFCNDY